MSVLFSKSDEKNNCPNADGDADAWDDTELLAAYNKAMMMAKNSMRKKKEHPSSNIPKKRTTNEDTKSGSSKSHSSGQWKVGMNCRTIYDEDNEIYEAVITMMLEDDYCSVQFLGYDNIIIRKLSELMPSLGTKARLRQVEEAIKDEYEEPKSDKRHKRKHKKKSKSSKIDDSDSITSDRPSHKKSMSLPMPPPPLLINHGEKMSKNEVMTSMLVSWYMCGYFTGLHEGKKRSRKRRESTHHRH